MKLSHSRWLPQKGVIVGCLTGMTADPRLKELKCAGSTRSSHRLHAPVSNVGIVLHHAFKTRQKLHTDWEGSASEPWSVYLSLQNVATDHFKAHLIQPKGSHAKMCIQKDQVCPSFMNNSVIL